MSTGIVGFLLLVAGADVASIVAGTLLLGVGMGWGAAVFPRFMDRLSEAERSFGFGLFRTVYMTVAATGSVVVGSLADLYGWAVAFGFLTGLLGLVCGLLFVNRVFGLDY